MKRSKCILCITSSTFIGVRFTDLQVQFRRVGTHSDVMSVDGLVIKPNGIVSDLEERERGRE